PPGPPPCPAPAQIRPPPPPPKIVCERPLPIRTSAPGPPRITLAPRSFPVSPPQVALVLAAAGAVTISVIGIAQIAIVPAVPGANLTADDTRASPPRFPAAFSDRPGTRRA